MDDYNANEAVAAIADAVLRFLALSDKQVASVRNAAQAMSKKALWDNLFTYYKKAYECAIESCVARTNRAVMGDGGASHEQMVRALMLSHLTVIYIKQSLGRLSALCGCVVAASGSSCGITYLMGGGYDEVAMAVKNMIGNLAGMICDGAKPSCAMKCASGVSTAVVSALMAMNGRVIKSVEGIIDDDVDRSIRNLTRIGSQGMNETDRLVLDIMTSKQCN